ncbi:Ankyrin repeat protein [Aspergillus fischeri NRRL 181]|uniref:Ankyrin repeat protein n=1 Tax=Neosartorya fischeri (strain ATCC 1020 / DSM 3700 / CBS 544.65 / FGSC A1164 / JCM 1740 / NRRL 181 / WB 181) TaxID=331117 RepID=A1DKH6_NEOFI|nr:Ankyrin repeat protein [Aspergillus fischeri NRRL 181]EAW17215.1 Ankyrin repeat protein [Aspergillus fischeri NRRL 181]
MSLLNLPLDVLYEIASHVDSDRDLNALAQTCSPLYTVFNFELYRRDAKRGRNRALFWAVQGNQNGTLWKSLDAGASAPWPTLLSLAAEHDSVLAMKVLLLQDGADIKAVEQTEEIPLLVTAVINRSPKVVRFLLTRDEVDPNVKNYDGQTPLAYVAYECFNDIVKILLKCPQVDVNCADNRGCTPLRLAAERSHVFVVRTLLSNASVDVSVRDNIHHRTALSAAVAALANRIAWGPEKVKLKHRRTIQALLEHPATSVNYDTDQDLLQLYRFSAQYGYEEIFNLLWSKGAGQLPAELDRSGILFFVAEHGQAGIMKMLFANGFEPEAQTDTGRTTLSIAAEHKQLEVIRLLLSTGKVDVNSKDQAGRTPLWWAMTHGWRKTGTDETVKLLIAHDATIPTIQRRKWLQKSLCNALEYGNCFLSEILLDQSQPISSKKRQTLLSAVAKSADISLAKTVLEKAQIDPNDRDSDGLTVLDRAVLNGDIALVDLLLVLDGIDLNSRNSNGDTALAIAMNEVSDCLTTSLGLKDRRPFETCMERFLRHKDVTTESLDEYWLIGFIVVYLNALRDQQLIKLLILKDDRLTTDTIVHEGHAETLLDWAQQNYYRTIVRALREKEKRMWITI